MINKGHKSYQIPHEFVQKFLLHLGDLLKYLLKPTIAFVLLLIKTSLNLLKLKKVKKIKS
jgi:hypothetical protein